MRRIVRRDPADPAGSWQQGLPTEGYSGITGYSDLWIAYPDRPGASRPADGTEPDWGALVEIPTIAVTGDVESARAEAERIAGGPVRVVVTDRPMEEARRIAAEMKADGYEAQAGIAANNPDAAVHVTVPYDDGTLQRRR